MTENKVGKLFDKETGRDHKTSISRYIKWLERKAEESLSLPSVSGRFQPLCAKCRKPLKPNGGNVGPKVGKTVPKIRTMKCWECDIEITNVVVENYR